jgi:Mrp family chromosome partitioning ATPase
MIHIAGRLKAAILQDQWLMAGLGIMVAAAMLLVVGLLWVKLRSKSKKQIASNQKEPEEPQKPEEKQDVQDKADENYRPIIERLSKVKKKYKSVLFAAWDIESLPVTIPVNVALELAKNKTRCLLIDLDVRRDAVAKAFDIEDRPELQSKASRTKLENLWVWPAHNFRKLRQMNIRLLVQKAIEKFDLVIINSPYLASSPDRNQILLSARAVVTFSRDASGAKELAKLIKASDCVLISNIQIPEATNKAAET